MSDERRASLAAGLAAVEDRVEAACAGVGRDADDVTIVVVTKLFPASDLRVLAELGVRHVGENRHQEAEAKRAACGDLDLTWHFVGGLQSNKAAAVGRWADVVHSVDRERLLAGLSRAARERDRPLDVLVQVSLDLEATEQARRSGVRPDDAVRLALTAAETDGLRLRGVMGVAPREGDPAVAFGRLSEVAGRVAAAVPGATWVSAGMSGDLEDAVRSGATHVRVGSAILGNRPTHR